MRGIITQSNYIPWKGYFDAISRADVFVIYDDMQYTRRDWRNRNIIKTHIGPKWLSIPVEVSGKYHQKICDVRVADKKWNRIHWEHVRHAYSKAGRFYQVRDWLQELFQKANHEFLTDVNEYFIREVCAYLGVSVEIRRSSEFQLANGRNERLVDLCVQLGIKTYITGPAAKSYIDENGFAEAGIRVNYLSYEGFMKYDQPFPPFVHNVSIVDLLCCVGSDSRNFALREDS